MAEWRLYGPPGTGKTTRLVEEISRAVRRRGHNAVVVASYTKAAASELVSRDLPIPKANVGTLHSLCHRNLGLPEIAEAHTAEWDALNPHLKVGGSVSDKDGGSFERGGGEGFLNQANVLRAKLIPVETWQDHRVRDFHLRWCDWKTANGYMDYTDMLEQGLAQLEEFPCKPEVLFVDEAQDMNPLMMKLVRQWGSHCEFFILAGDPDQTIFSHVGSSYEQFVNSDVPEEHIITLDQSYRVPQKVQTWAVNWISKDRDRRQIIYKPREAQGEVRKIPCDVESKISEIVTDMEQYLDQDKTIMFLTTCGYMLTTIKAELRSRGLAFHNPYRAAEPSWNPLNSSKGISTAQRLRSFFSGPSWTCDDALNWIELLKIKPSGFYAKTKGVVEAMSKMRGEGANITPSDIFDAETDEGQEAQMLFVYGNDEEKLAWILEGDKLKAQFKKSVTYPMALMRDAMAKGLSPQEPFIKDPQIVIGTIHSVKGGQADVVYLCPDISRAAYIQWLEKGRNKENWKSTLRTFYVGATRSRETLVLLEASSRYNVTQEGWTV